MVRIERFRSTWGVEPGENFGAWKPLFIKWKELGYDGVEFVPYDLDDDQRREVRELCDDLELKISITYRGPRQRGLTPDVHLDGYREELRRAEVLNPVKINAQSGALRITGDFSHWIVGCERLLDVGEEDQELLDRVIPHVSAVFS
ncbi:hypothetical protein ACHAPJ_013012 [Fusarium lateritium]